MPSTQYKCSVSAVNALIKYDLTLNRNLLNTEMYFVLSRNIKMQNYVRRYTHLTVILSLHSITNNFTLLVI